MMISKLPHVPLFIVRGPQGSGKSTFAKTLRAKRGHIQIEPDDYFQITPSVYVWERGLNNRAQEWTRWRMNTLLTLGRMVVVTEIFPLREQIREYIRTIPRGLEYAVVRATGEYRNVHGVPAEQVQATRDSMEPWPGEIIL